MVGIRSAKSCQTDFQNSRAITVRATPDRRGPAGGATCSDPTRGLYGGHVPRRESPAMYRVRPYRPFALALLVGALACTIRVRSEEHTSELQSRNDISYAVFCLK